MPVYWRNYGPFNLLWASDVALFLVLGTLWSERPLLNSMVAVGILPFDIAWCMDFATGAALLGATDYMFEADRPLLLRAVPTQLAPTWILLPMTYLFTNPADNINLAFGLGHGLQSSVNALMYLLLFMLALPLAVLWPMHALLCRIFPRR